jgi:hypothetical protein
MNKDATPRRSGVHKLLLHGIGYLFCGVAAGSTAHAQDLGALEQAMIQAGYHLYNPPRTNWGPGFVFSGDVNNGRIINVQEICPNLYVDLEAPTGATVVLPDFKAEDKFTFRLALDFLKRLVGADNSAKLELVRLEHERKVEVQWQDVREFAYSKVDQWLKSGEPRPVEQRCRSAIDDLRAKGRFKDRVYVIARAVAPEVLTFDFARSTAGEVGANATLGQALEAAAQGRAEVHNNTELRVKQRLFVGYAAPIKLEEWLPTGLVSGGIVGVRGTPADLLIEEPQQ